MNKIPIANFSSDASGARHAGMINHVVVIVDVIDMSTTMEAALEAGAHKVFGACPDDIIVPVPVDPVDVGRKAGELSKKLSASVVIAAEPRWGENEKRINSSRSVIAGLKEVGINHYKVIPNLGISATKLVDFKDKVVIGVTNTGGVAFDAALKAGGEVITATIARTWKNKGLRPAEKGVVRALELAKTLGKDITFVAASSQSMEDVLAAQFLTHLALLLR